MVKSPDERPFLAVFKLRLASANYMATPYRSEPEHLVWSTVVNNSERDVNKQDTVSYSFSSRQDRVKLQPQAGQSKLQSQTGRGYLQLQLQIGREVHQCPELIKSSIIKKVS